MWPTEGKEDAQRHTVSQPSSGTIVGVLVAGQMLPSQEVKTTLAYFYH